MNILPQSRPQTPCGGTSPDLTNLAYRYFFFGWLFRDAGVADPWVSSAALAFNVRQRHYLPIYIRRWTVIFSGFAALGLCLEQLTNKSLAAAPDVVAVFALCYLIITVRVFVSLAVASHHR